MFTKVLVANRGEIACRIIKTLDRLGITSVAIYSDVDRDARHVLMATEAVFIGNALAKESYLRSEYILEMARQTGAEAIHPGYGFLSENPDFAEACDGAGIIFIGPTSSQLRQFGLKHLARGLAAENNVPMLLGSQLLENLAQAKVVAEDIGYPVMLKSTAGGGGIGMEVCFDEGELVRGFDQVERLSRANFQDSGIFLEKYIQTARHIEVQIFGDGKGNVIALGDRDCSTQRRNQKVIEETPAPGISNAVREQLYQGAVRLGRAVNYQSAGTVEYIFDVETQQFYFLEVNTRLQVEHCVTEMVSNIDLVEWMVCLAAGDSSFLEKYLEKYLDNSYSQPQGHSIEARIYAEDANKNFQPSSGLLTFVKFPESIRCDSWIETGTEVSPFYDPLLAKLIVWGRNRDEAIALLHSSLKESEIAGIETNLDYLRQVVNHPSFTQAQINTRFLNSFNYQPSTIDILDPGTYTTIQDYPGRIGYWDIGVPPSGPMDNLAFRLGNRILGNPESAAGLECTVLGPTLLFNCNTVICLTGAAMKATLNGELVPFWTPVSVTAGSILKLKGIQGHGYRTYIAVEHGFDVPDYLGSKATFTLGKFGGHGGRTLTPGDVLRLNVSKETLTTSSLAPELVPEYTNNWEIAVLYGPHGAPDFFTEEDIEMLFSTNWTIHHNSARTGIRLIGPKPQWARKDGGEAGLHPSNIHDNAYAIGTIDFTGDMPIILAYDGPSLGGFVCPGTIIQAELWKIGQLKPGDTVRFYCITAEEARCKELEQDLLVRDLFVGDDGTTKVRRAGRKEDLRDLFCLSPILQEISESSTQIAVTYRQAGDKYLLVEYGSLVLDFNLRFRVHGLMLWLQENHLPGIIDLTPGIRSLQIHYDSRILPLGDLLNSLTQAEYQLQDIENIEVSSRIVNLPLSWNDKSTQLAIEKYMQSVRSDAPWCPSNIEFIRRINGLESVEEVKEIIFNASYLVLGLGDVYLGAPVATPLDPRHRLVTTKYNPARTWTPENAVGIGGAYMCIYGMEGPGGYQFVGRTVQVWNRHKKTTDFSKPWLLRFFDQIKFFPVSPDGLLRYRQDLIQGKVKLDICEEKFRLKEYQQFLNQNSESIAAFKAKQQAAFQREREQWAVQGEFTRQQTLEEVELDKNEDPEIILSANTEAIKSHVSANVWQVLVKQGDQVREGDRLIILEAMKMEIAVTADKVGTISHIFCTQGQMVSPGQILIAMRN
jgi:urea carboxylase